MQHDMPALLAPCPTLPELDRSELVHRAQRAGSAGGQPAPAIAAAWVGGAQAQLTQGAATAPQRDCIIPLKRDAPAEHSATSQSKCA